MHAATAPTLRTALRHPGFGRLLTATAVSAAGDYVNGVAIVTVVYAATGSAAWLSAAAVLRVLTWAGATALGGVVSDRVDRRPLLRRLSLVAAALAAALVVVDAADAPVAALVCVATLLDLTAGICAPAFSASVPTVVGETDVAAANAAVSTVEQLSMVAGPAIGAVLVAATSPSIAFAVNAATFLVAALLVPPAAASNPTTAGDGSTGMRHATRWLAANRPAAALVTAFAAALASYGMSMVLFVLVAADRLGMADGGIGYLRMAEGVGGVALGLVAGRSAARHRVSHPLAAMLLGAAAPVALAFLDARWLALAAVALGGGAYVVLEVTVITWLQEVLPPDLLGRVMGLLMSLGAVATAAGAGLAAPLASWTSLSTALVVSGLVILLPGLACAHLLHAAATSAAAAPAHRIAAELSELDLFAGAPDGSLSALAASVAELQVDAGTAVVTEGGTADDVFVVRAGSFEVTAVGEHGSPRVVDHLVAGDWFGEVGVMTGRPRTATVTATEGAVVWRIPGARFTEAFSAGALGGAVVRSRMIVRLGRTHPSLVGAD